MTTKHRNILTRLLAATLFGSALLALAPPVQAQEIQLTGPLAGAPATRKLRLHREGRFELAPSVTFTLLDEYQRTILLGARLGYNFTDWLAIGAYAGYGGLLQLPTSLTEQIQEQNALRIQNATPPPPSNALNTERRLTAVNLGPEFEEQLGGIDWILAPQITAIPFRGKLALFQSIYMDTDLYLFAGPAFVGITERADCTDNCVSDNTTPFEMASRVGITATFGLGLNFYINQWAAVSWDYRILPLSWNRGGFDTAGGGKDEEFPDNQISDADRQFELKQLMSISFVVNLPAKVRISE